jgi:hypothetical protein
VHIHFTGALQGGCIHHKLAVSRPVIDWGVVGSHVLYMQFIFQRSTDISHRKISKVESLHPGPKVSPSFKPSLQEYKNNSFLAILASDSNLLGLLSPTFQANPKFKHGFTVQTLLFVGGGPIFYHFLYDLDERWSSNWELQPEQVGIA